MTSSVLIKQILSTIATTLLMSSQICSQPRLDWIKYYDVQEDFDYFYDVFSAPGSEIAACGYSRVDGELQVLLLVTDVNGNERFIRTFPRDENSQADISRSIIQTDDGGYALATRRASAGHLPGDFSILRVNPEGDLIWWENYNIEHSGLGINYAVIEAKDGGILAVGQAANEEGDIAYAVMTGNNGEVTWERYYGPGSFFSVLEVVDEGYIIGGSDYNHQPNNWFLKINQNGDVIWERYQNHGVPVLVSCQNTGYATIGADTTGWYLLRVNRQAQFIWESHKEMEHQPPRVISCTGLTRTRDGGFALVGQNTQYSSFIWRTDDEGNEMWSREYQYEDQDSASEYFSAVIVGHDNSIVAAGMGSNGDRNDMDGLLIKLIPDISQPVIVTFFPPEPIISVLQNDRIEFRVIANDRQGDEIHYQWYRNDERVGNNSTFRPLFRELGLDLIKCTVSDDQLGDSATWHVTVTDLYVSAFTPDTLNLTVRRGTSVDFSLDTIRYTDGAEPEILWTKTNLSNGQSEETGGDARCTIDFPWSGEYSVEGRVSRGESSDAVAWHVQVKGAIWAYVPLADSLDVLPDSVVHFEVVPSAPEDESLEVSWLVNGELVREGELTLDWAFGEADSSADLNRHYLVRCVVADSVEADTVQWVVMVSDLSTPRDPAVAALPVTALLHVSPNPFNSTLTIRYQSVKSAQSVVNLSIYDISGREVANLPGSTGVTAGQGFHPAAEGGATTNGATAEQLVVWNAAAAPAGVYFVRLQVGGYVSTKKVVLMR